MIKIYNEKNINNTYYIINIILFIIFVPSSIALFFNSIFNLRSILTVSCSFSVDIFFFYLLII